MVLKENVSNNHPLEPTSVHAKFQGMNLLTYFSQDPSGALTDRCSHPYCDFTYKSTLRPPQLCFHSLLGPRVFLLLSSKRQICKRLKDKEFIAGNYRDSTAALACSYVGKTHHFLSHHCHSQLFNSNCVPKKQNTVQESS